MDAYRRCPFRCGWTYDAVDETAIRGALCVHLTAEHGANGERDRHAYDAWMVASPPGTRPAREVRAARALGRLTPFLVSYRGELTEDDRVALDRPGFSPWSDDGDALESERYCGVRVNAHSADEAEHLVIEALGRRPEALVVR